MAKRRLLDSAAYFILGTGFGGVVLLFSICAGLNLWLLATAWILVVVGWVVGRFTQNRPPGRDGLGEQTEADPRLS